MTLLPSESWNVEGVEGKPVRVGPICSVPDCTRWADHAHHLFRRSFLASDHMNWVKVDGRVTSNLTGLCYQHHQDVTENRAWIKYAEGRYSYWRNVPRLFQDILQDDWVCLGDLDPQPPIADEAEETRTSVTYEEKACPTCKRRLPKPSLAPLPRRQRKTWVVSVPDDSEDGAAVLDVLVEECAKIFERDEHNDFRYFTLVEAMSLLLQHQQQLTS